MKPELTRKLIGGASVLAGLWWVLGIVFFQVCGFWRGGIHTGEVLFALIMVPLISVPGVLALVCGVRLYRAMSIAALKWVVGIFGVFLALYLSEWLARECSGILPQRVLHNIALFVSSAAVIPAYVHVVRLLLRHLTNDAPAARLLVSRGVVLLMAWQLWFLLSSAFQECSPIKAGYAHVPEEFWGILGLVVPIVVAYGSYRLVIARLDEAGQCGACLLPAQAKRHSMFGQ